MYKIGHNFVEIHAEHLLIPAEQEGLQPSGRVLKIECNYSVHVRTVQLKSVLFTVKNRVEHYLHLGAFFSATIDGRNLIFGHKLHIGMPYCGKRV
jgi:hypothetical protein